MPRIAFRNFTGGEVTPTLSARYDLQKYGTFLQSCENFIPNLHGDIERRPGTHFVADLGEACVMLPFQFNTEPENNYVLLFGVSTIRVARAGGVVEGVNMDSPYELADVYGLSFHQTGDILYLAHRKYALHKLTRSGTGPDYTWRLAPVALNQSLPAPGKPNVAFIRDNADDEAVLNYTLRYVVTAVDGDGVESLPSAVGEVKGKYPTDWVVGNHVTVTWPAVSGAAEYNIYRESAGYYGFIGVASSTSFDDQNFEPDTSITPKEDWNPFANGNNPATVTIHQQRLVLAGTKDSPASFYMSRTGDFESFRKSYPLQDDDPVEYMLASGSIDDIKWVASFGELLVGTSGAEYGVSSSGAAITPSDVQIKTESYWGSANLQPMIIGNSILHCQRAGAHIRDLYYSWESDGYAGNDLSLLAPQLVETHRIRQWAFQQAPGSCVWAVRDDGVLLCLTYMQEQKVYAWSRHSTEGEVLSAVSLCGEQEDILMLVVKRVVNGQVRYFLERMAGRFKATDAIEDAFFVDCGKTIVGGEATKVFSGFEHLEGQEVVVLADGAPEEGHVVQGGKIELYYPARKVSAGLNYTSVLAPMPVETDGQNGSTLGKRRSYGKVVLRLYRTVGGRYAASRVGDIFDVNAWKGRQFDDLPFLPEYFGEAVQPFSGDMALTLEAGQDEDTIIWIKQDRPQPFRLVAIGADIDFGEA